ncbi:hypothetical protein D9M71_227530 [compost metagenome]
MQASDHPLHQAITLQIRLRDFQRLDAFRFFTMGQQGLAEMLDALIQLDRLTFWPARQRRQQSRHMVVVTRQQLPSTDARNQLADLLVDGQPAPCLQQQAGYGKVIAVNLAQLGIGDPAEVGCGERLHV